MRRESLPDGGNIKVIWKFSRDRKRDKASRQRNSETWWRRTTATLLGVSFGSYRRRRRDVLMGRRGYVPLKRLGDVPLRCLGCFIWDSFETSWRRTDGTSLLRPLETFSQHSNKTSLKTNYWDVLATFHWDVVGCFIWDLPATSLGRTQRCRYDIHTTSCCRVRQLIFFLFNTLF